MKSVFESNFFSPAATLNFRGRLLSLHRPRVMGILNVTPDSFFDGGQYANPDAAVTRAGQMLAEGADIIDVGGYSTRPGAADISVAEEISRVVPVVRGIVSQFPRSLVSVDTFRSTVAEAAVAEGATMINDVSGGTLDAQMGATVARLQVPYVLMHMRGTPQTMTHQTSYTNLLKDVTDYFHQQIDRLRQLGVKDIVLDPGFGFAKTAEQNFTLLRHLDRFMVGKPLLVGISRKSMVWRTLSVNAANALNGTTALHAIALQKGASILRVHDVREAAEVVTLHTKVHGDGHIF